MRPIRAIAWQKKTINRHDRCKPITTDEMKILKKEIFIYLVNKS